MHRLFFSAENVLSIMAGYADSATLALDLPALAGCGDLSPIWMRITEKNDTWRAVVRNTYPDLTKEERSRVEKEAKLVLLARQNLQKWQPQLTRLLDLQKPISHCDHLSPKVVGNYLLGVKKSAVTLWSLENGECIGSFRESGKITAFKVHQGFLFTGTIQGSVAKWKIDTRGLEEKMRGHKQTITVIKAAGTRLYTGSVDHTIRVWDIETLVCIRIFTGHKDTVTALKAAGERLFSVSLDRTAKIWDIEKGSCLHTFNHPLPIAALKLFQGSLFTGEYSRKGDSCVREWDIHSGECLGIFGKISNGGVMPDKTIESYVIRKIMIIGDRLISCGFGFKSLIWDRNTREAVDCFWNPTRFILRVGDRLCASTYLESAGIFHAYTGDLLQSIDLMPFFYMGLNPKNVYLSYSEGRLVATDGSRVKLLDFNPQPYVPLTIWQKAVAFLEALFQGVP